MTKVLVACASYPFEGSTDMKFVHERNLCYVRKGIEVDVLNFSSQEKYLYEGINVFPLDYIKNNISKYSDYVLLCHAPNIRNHYLFLKKYKEAFKNIIFFFHGHEIVKISEAYPPDYSFRNNTFLKKIIQNTYDKLKLCIWNNYFTKNDTNSRLVFVSDSLKKDFCKFVKISLEIVEKRSSIINNCAGSFFCTNKYNMKTEKKYDYITIRDNLDSSVYCIDLIVQNALLNQDKKYLIIGKGRYFDYYDKPKNITLIGKTMNHEKLATYINISKCALMPTRRDSQGVMVSELATFGIPVITSNLDVCKEMFSDFGNVFFLDENQIINLDKELTFSERMDNNEKFFEKNTIDKEIKLIREL